MAFGSLGDNVVNNFPSLEVTKNATRAVKAPGGDIGLTPPGGKLVNRSLNGSKLTKAKRRRPSV